MNALTIEYDPKTTVPIPAPADNAIIGVIERAARDPLVDIDKLQRLLELRSQIEAKEAETAFDLAMTEAQSEMRPIARDADNKQTTSRYASYTQLDRALRPIYTKYGFSLSFNTGAETRDNFVLVTCRVSKGGYHRDYQVPMPADGKGPRGNDVMTKTHATGSAVSYGMRYLLKMIFNVAIGEYDDDGNAAGKKGPPVSEKSPVQPQMTPPPAHDPVTGETGPRALPLKQDKDGAWARYIQWGATYIAACKAAQSLEELDKWGTANHAALHHIKEKAPKIYARIGPNVEEARAKLVAKSKPPVIDQPEEFLAHIDATLAEITTPDKLVEVWNDEFAVKLGNMFPPDAAIATQMFEARLAELQEQEAK